MCQKAVQEHGTATHLVCSSGGNAGLAVAYAGRQLEVRVTIVVPMSCSQFMKQKIEFEGATVEMEGEVWINPHFFLFSDGRCSHYSMFLNNGSN